MSEEVRAQQQSFLDKLEEKLKKRVDGEDGAPKDSFHHSTSYHDFFEGYAEARVPNRNGKGSHIERVYVGEYYRQNVSDGKRAALRLIYVGFYLLSAALFAYGMQQRVPSNSSLCVAAPGLLSSLAYVLMLPVLLSYVTQPRNMTVWGYRSSSKRLEKLPLVTAALVFATAAAVLAYCLWSAQDSISGELVCIVCYTAASALLGAIGGIERTVDYVTEPSRHAPSGDTIIIQ